MISIKRLRECLSYNAKTGRFRWRVSSKRGLKVGDIAGTTNKRGYVYITVDGHQMLAHRIAWAMHYGEWPKGDIDHRNEIKDANWISNLRLATRSRNMANIRRKLPPGVYRSQGKYIYSCIRIGGKMKYLGSFSEPASAARAFANAHREHHGEFSLL